MGLYLALFAVVEIREKRGVVLSPEQHSKLPNDLAFCSFLIFFVTQNCRRGRFTPADGCTSAGCCITCHSGAWAVSSTSITTSQPYSSPACCPESSWTTWWKRFHLWFPVGCPRASATCSLWQLRPDSSTVSTCLHRSFTAWTVRHPPKPTPPCTECAGWKPGNSKFLFTDDQILNFVHFFPHSISTVFLIIDQFSHLLTHLDLTFPKYN